MMISNSKIEKIIKILKLWMMLFLSMCLGMFFMDSVNYVIVGIVPINWIIYFICLVVLLLDWMLKEFDVYGEDKYSSECKAG